MISHFLFCWPKQWEIMDNGKLTYRAASVGAYWNLKCKKCGWIIQRRCY